MKNKIKLLINKIKTIKKNRADAKINYEYPKIKDEIPDAELAMQKDAEEAEAKYYETLTH